MRPLVALGVQRSGSYSTADLAFNSPNLLSSQAPTPKAASDSPNVENPRIDNQKDDANRQNLPPSSTDNQSPRAAPSIIHRSSFTLHPPETTAILAAEPYLPPTRKADGRRYRRPRMPSLLRFKPLREKMPRLARWHVNCCTDIQRRRLPFLVPDPRRLPNLSTCPLSNCFLFFSAPNPYPARPYNHPQIKCKRKKT